MRTAIYGGTFNPIHNAHIHLLEEISKEMNFDRVFVIPTSIPPHKESEYIASGEDRINMCKLALKEFSFPFKVLDIELKRSGKSYTVDTLKELKTLYPDDEFYLIMGEDMFITLDRWFKFEEIIKMTNICAVIRSEDGLSDMLIKKSEYENLGACCYIINVDFIDISSSMIREKIKNDEDIRFLVSEEVFEYIKKRKMYRE